MGSTIGNRVRESGEGVVLHVDVAAGADAEADFDFVVEIYQANSKVPDFDSHTGEILGFALDQVFLYRGKGPTEWQAASACADILLGERWLCPASRQMAWWLQRAKFGAAPLPECQLRLQIFDKGCRDREGLPNYVLDRPRNWVLPDLYISGERPVRPSVARVAHVARKAKEKKRRIAQAEWDHDIAAVLGEEVKAEVPSPYSLVKDGKG